MPIIGTKPVVIPEVVTPEKVFDAYWMRDFSISAPIPGKPVNVTFSLVPYVSKTGELYLEQIQKISVTDVLEKSKTDPEMDAIISALLDKAQKIAIALKKI